MSMSQSNMWEYGHEQSDWADDRLIGYSVEATDGGIGKVDSATVETGSQSIVVDTSKLPLFGRQVMLPAGMVDRVDHDDQRVYLSCTKDQVKDSPEFTDDSNSDPSYREKLGDYYGGFGTSPRTDPM